MNTTRLVRPLVSTSLRLGTRSFASTPFRLAVAEALKQSPAVAKEKPQVQEKNAPGVRLPETQAGAVTGDWVLMHPVYSPKELDDVQVIVRENKTISDKVAASLVKLLRKGFDLVTGYKHKEMPKNYKEMSVTELRKGGYIMDEKQWLMRILFLETVAGVPGMVAATLRHLRSLRMMRRDAGWIHTLLEESENERMHLMTFMTLKKPSLAFRALILGAQGVFYNAFFISYALSPRTAHRFVGKLEEEAVYTYTKCIKDLEEGLIPEWTDKPAPKIAIDYWRLPENASLYDVIKAVRADEAGHRFVNHSLANLKHNEDVNPFAIREASMSLKGTKAGFEREEAAEFLRETTKQGKQAKDALESDALH